VGKTVVLWALGRGAVACEVGAAGTDSSITQHTLTPGLPHAVGRHASALAPTHCAGSSRPHIGPPPVCPSRPSSRFPSRAPTHPLCPAPHPTFPIIPTLKRGADPAPRRIDTPAPLSPHPRAARRPLPPFAGSTRPPRARLCTPPAPPLPRSAGASASFSWPASRSSRWCPASRASGPRATSRRRARRRGGPGGGCVDADWAISGERHHARPLGPGAARSFSSEMMPSSGAR
jgi:hypothetical protein